MQKGFLSALKKILADRHRRKVWQRIVSSMMAVVVFCTTYALILPGITLERQTYCGLEEHTHTDECYAKDGGGGLKKLICDPESEAEFVIHTHDDMCYRNGELICPLDELEEHEHTDDCYSVTQELICDKEESEGHTHSDECYEQTLGELTCDDTSETHEHDDSCYEQSEELVCGQEESEGHTHDDSCYIENKELVCGFPEVVEHKHDDSCYENGVLACGKAEIVKHQHTDECFETVNVIGGSPEELDCGKEEHKHTDECYKKTEEETSSSSGGGGGGGSSAAKEEETAVDGATETTTVSADEATETTTAEHEDLVFPYSDDNVSGIITLPWSEELPDDLKCEPVIITKDDDGYSSMVDSVDSAAVDKGKRVENLYLYRLEWTTGEENDTYVLPEGLTPTVKFTVLNASDDKDIKVRGIVIKDKEPGDEDEITEDEVVEEEAEALNTMIDKFSLNTIDEVDIEAYEADDEDIATNVYMDESEISKLPERDDEMFAANREALRADDTDYTPNVDVNTTTYEDEDNYEAEIIPSNTEDHSIDVDLTSVGIFAFAELSESDSESGDVYGSDGYFKRITDLSELRNDGNYVIVAQNGVKAVQAGAGSNSMLYNTGYTDELGRAGQVLKSGYKYKTTQLEVQRLSTTLDSDSVNAPEYYRLVDPNNSDAAITPTAYSNLFWNIKSSEAFDGYGIAKYGATAEINDEADNAFEAFKAFNTGNALVFGGDSNYTYTKKYRVLGQVFIEKFNNTSWKFSGYAYNVDHDQMGNTVSPATYTLEKSYFYTDSTTDRVYQMPTRETALSKSADSILFSGFQIYEYCDKNKASVSDADAASKVEPSVIGTISVSFKPRTKAKCARFVDVSGAQSIEDTLGIDRIMNGADISAKSDPSTSQIEAKFCLDGSETDAKALYDKQAKNNGRVVSDKSVIYGTDDYNAFDAKDYKKGEFSVALSTLGQEWQVDASKVAKTPLDVVFIYDLSGSMRANDEPDSTTPKWVASANAISDAMKEIYEANPLNRAGLVAFSNCAEDVLPIGRYSADDDALFKYTVSDMVITGEVTGSDGQQKEDYVPEEHQDNGMRTLSLSDSLRDGYTTDENISSSTYAGKTLYNDGMGAATNTQQGLQQAYNLFRKVDSTQVYIDSIKKTVDRQPLIILVTDGDPTFCTFNYMNPLQGPTYGDGLSKALDGYYTILSANYFKNLTSIFYNRQACFYTIGMGIKDSGYGTLYDEQVPDAASYNSQYRELYAYYPDHSYMRAVLDPTKDNIDMLDSYSKHWEELAATADSDSVASDMKTTQRYVKELWELTSKPLKELLTGKTTDGADVDPGTVWSKTMYMSSSQNPGLTGEIIIRDGLGYTENMVNAAINPYGDDYNYVDGAYFGELSRSDLDDIFDKIVTSVTTNSRYDFLLKAGSNVVMTDPIGTNMEVKGEPVLRYFGTNYAIDKDKTVNGSDDTSNYVEYHWKGTAKRLENSDAKADDSTVDISGIVARVSTNKTTGDQTVTFTIPEDVLPTFYPDLARAFYYEELPIRLIFRVGLTEKEEQRLKDEYEVTKEITGTYYTNKYGNDGVATVTFEPDESDPYYENFNGTVTENKSSNTTQTESYSFVENYDKDADVVTQKLGNNGVLTLAKDNTLTVNVEKVWANKEKDHPDYVVVGLYVDGTKTDGNGNKTAFSRLYAYVKLSDSNNWKHVWKKLPREEVINGCTYNYDVYYVGENAIDGYTPSYTDALDRSLVVKNSSYSVPQDLVKDVVNDSTTGFLYGFDFLNAYSADNESIEAMSFDDVESSQALTAYSSENPEDVNIEPMVMSLKYKVTTTVANANNGSVVITNIDGYNLPYTGGSGKLVTFSAITLLFGALFMYILKRRKEMRS